MSACSLQKSAVLVLIKKMNIHRRSHLLTLRSELLITWVTLSKFIKNFCMLNEMLNNFFFWHVFKSFDTDSALIQVIDCYLIDTVSQQTISLSIKGHFSTKKSTTVLQSYIQTMSWHYIKLHKKLKHFEIILVSVLKNSKNAPIMQ